MAIERRYTSLWYYILVLGTLLFSNRPFLFSQSDSSAYYLEEIETHIDLVLEDQISHDSCIAVFKVFHRYALNKEKEKQGITEIRKQIGRIIRAKAYGLTIEIVDSLSLWVEPQLLDEKSEEDFIFLYIYKGYLFMLGNKHLSAIDAYEEALEKYQTRFKDLCNDESVIRCLLTKEHQESYDQLWRFILRPLVILHNKIGDYDLAKSFLPRQDELGLIINSNILSEREISTIYQEMVGISLAKKDTSTAYRLSQEAFDLHNGETSEKFEAQLNLANIERTLKKFDDAQLSLDQVIKYVEKQSGTDRTTSRLWVDGHLFKGYTFRDEALRLINQDPERARILFEKSRNEYDLLISTFLGQKPLERKELIHLYHSRGDIDYYSRNYLEAETYYQKALSLINGNEQNVEPNIDSLALDFDFFYTLEGLGKIWYKQYEKDKNLSLLNKASDTYTLVFALEDSFRVRYPTQESRQTQQKNSQKRLKTRMHIAHALWQEKKEESSILMALNIMDRSRALEMQAHLLENAIERNLNSSDKKLIDTISAIQEELYQVYLETQGEDEQTIQDSLIQKKNEELLAYRKKLKKENPSYYRLKFTPHTSELKKIQEKLSDKEALVNFYWEGSKLYQLIIGKDFYDLSQQAITKKFIKDIATIITFTKNPRPKKRDQLAYQKSAYTVYEKLLKHLENHELDEIIIVPDGPLNYLAFDALITEKVGENKTLDYRQLKYVIQKYIVRYQFVPLFLLQEEIERVSKDQVSMLYAGFAPTYNFEYTSQAGRSTAGNLEFNIHEIDSVFQLFSAFTQDTERFIGAEARESKFREIAPMVELLHIAMHAFNNEDTFDSSFVKDPYLLFSNERVQGIHDDRLFMREIYGLGLKAELMVLSACNTGTGEWEAGEGMLSLGRAFRMAGCSNIISSLWNVNDESSQKVIQTFYKFLLNGEGKAEALKKAKVAYLFDKQISTRKAAPYYWAQFVLMGDNSRLTILEHQNNPSHLILGGIIALVLLIGLGIYWRRIK